jgi:preprotein translocase subunit SecG
MQTVLIVIHLMIVVALVGVVLLQRSEGGGLGIGGGGGGGGLMSARGAADTLTRTTSILAAGFFLTSIGLGLLARYGEAPTDILDRVPAQVQQDESGTAPSGGNGILDQLGGQDSTPAATPEAPAAPAAPAVPNN